LSFNFARTLALTALVSVATLLTAQQAQQPPQPKPLSVENIYSATGILGRIPMGLRWSPDSKHLTLNKQGDLLELDLAVEIILEGLLAPRGHDDDLVDAGGEEFLDDEGNRGPGPHREKLLGDCLGDGKEAGAVAGSDNDAFHCDHPSPEHEGALGPDELFAPDEEGQPPGLEQPREGLDQPRIELPSGPGLELLNGRSGIDEAAIGP